MSTNKKIRASLGPLVKVSRPKKVNDQIVLDDEGNPVMEELSLQLELTQDITVHSPVGDKSFKRGDKIYFNKLENHFEKQQDFGKVESASDALEALKSKDRARSKNDAGIYIDTLRFSVATEVEQKNYNKEA